MHKNVLATHGKDLYDINKSFSLKKQNRMV